MESVGKISNKATWLNTSRFSNKEALLITRHESHPGKRILKHTHSHTIPSFALTSQTFIWDPKF